MATRKHWMIWDGTRPLFDKVAYVQSKRELLGRVQQIVGRNDMVYTPLVLALPGAGDYRRGIPALVALSQRLHRYEGIPTVVVKEFHLRKGLRKGHNPISSWRKMQ